MDNFANAPPSITELRSDRTKKATDWTPRDCLVSILRDVDSGKLTIEQIAVVIIEKDDDEKIKDSISVAGPYTTFALIGMLQQQIYKYMRDW